METILATTSTFGTISEEAERELTGRSYLLVKNPYERKLTEDELLELLTKYHPVGLLAGTEPITQAVLDASAEHLKVISRVGVGWDNVDRSAAERAGIAVYRTIGVLDNSVAELTVGLMLDALRGISLQDREIRSGKWKKRMGSLLMGKTVGIIGFGAIGRRVGELVHAFGAEVLFSDPIEIAFPHARQVTTKKLLNSVDIVSLHAGGRITLMDAEYIGQCKRGVVIVNTARGGMVDEAALLAALRRGHVGFACLDVFEQEPYKGPLTTVDNVVLTSHVGSYAAEARIHMERMAVDNLLEGLGNIV